MVRNRLLDQLQLASHTARTITGRDQLASELREIAARDMPSTTANWRKVCARLRCRCTTDARSTIAANRIVSPAVAAGRARCSSEHALPIHSRIERIEHALFTESRVFPQKARPRGPFPHLKRVDDFIFVSGTSARRPDDTFEGVRIDADGSVTFDVRRQTRAVFENIRDMLAQVGAGLRVRRRRAGVPDRHGRL